MSSAWIRGQSQRPKKRRIVLIYDTGESENAAIEEMLERIPYGQGNKKLLECLRIGVSALLPGGANASPAVKKNSAAQPEASATGVTSEAGSQKTTEQAFSNSAVRMFGMGETAAPDK